MASVPLCYKYFVHWCHRKRLFEFSKALVHWCFEKVTAPKLFANLLAKYPGWSPF